jgi:hypothetical protein
MAVQSSKSPVNLFRQHGARQLVRKGHGRKRQQQIGPWLPFRRKAIMTADEKHKILRLPCRGAEDLNESSRIQRATRRVEKDLARRRMPGKKVKPVGDNFAHFAGGIATAALDKLGRNGVGVFIARFADEIQEDLQDTPVIANKLSLCFAELFRSLVHQTLFSERAAEIQVCGSEVGLDAQFRAKFIFGSVQIAAVQQSAPQALVGVR